MTHISKQLSSKYTYWLLLIFLWHTPLLASWDGYQTAYAQNLSSPAIGESSTELVPSAHISLKQWQDLQVASSQALLQDQAVLQYFEESFDIDGRYGELKTGAIVSDWETIAKTMGTSGLALAGAYSVYRRRRQDYLAPLRSGDAKAIETLFEEHFGEIQSSTSSSQYQQSPTPLPSATPPHNNDAWQEWGEKQGLPAAGATLATLYALWLKRKSTPQTSTFAFNVFFKQFFSAQTPVSYSTFRQNVSQSVKQLQQSQKDKALADFEAQNPAPIAPVKSQNILDYEALNQHYMHCDKPYYEALNAAHAISYNNTGKINALIPGILKTWQQYFYYQATGNQTGMQITQRNAQSLITYAQRFATSRQNWQISTLKDTALYYFNRNKAEFEAQAQQQGQYESDLAAYQQKKTDTLNQAGNQYNTWHQTAYSWWQQAYQSANDSQKWLLNLGHVRTQSTVALEKQQQQKDDNLTQSLLQLTQSYSPEALNQVVSGTNPSLSQKTFTSVESLQAQLENLKNDKVDNDTWVQYRDQYFHRQGYGGNYQYGYTKYTYMPDRERWEHRRVGRLDDTPAKQAFEYFYNRQIYQVQQQIEATKAENLRLSYENKNVKTPSIQALTQFIQTLHRFPQDPRVQSAIKTLAHLQSTQANLKAAQDELNLNDNSWTKTESLNHRLTQLKNNLNQYAHKLITFQKSFLEEPAQDNQISLVSQAASVSSFETQLEENAVYQYLKQQAEAKTFYQTYGQDKSVLDTIKTQLEAKIESLSYLDENYAYYYDHAIYADYQALKNDYKKALNNQLPDVWMKNWSWYSNSSTTYRRTAVPNRNDALLHDWYHKSVTLYNTEAKQDYVDKIKEREAMLFEQRALVFEAQQQQQIKDLFSEKEILDYQELMIAKDEKTQQLKALNEAEAITKQVAQATVDQQNSSLIQTPESNRSLAVQTLKKSDVTTIALSYASDSNKSITSNDLTQIPPQYLEALYQAYRRYNHEHEFQNFTLEVERLITQAKQNYRRGLIIDSGMPTEPVQNKTVRDYLEDPDRFNQDVDKQIETIEKGIPLLHQKFAGQEYLNTALAQAKAKIEALERYKKSGPEEVSTYKSLLHSWQQTNAYVLTQIDAGVNNHFGAVDQFTQGFWDKSDEIVAQKTTEIEASKIIDTRDTVELIKQTPGGFSTEDESVKEELEAFLTNLSNGYEQVANNPSFELTNQAANSQAKLYNTYESKFLRSQGLTSSSRNNFEIENLHPEIRTQAINFINTVEDELGIRLTISDGFRSFEEQQNLYNQGRENNNPIVTNAKGGESYHNYGLAFDVVQIIDGKVNYKLDWEKISAIAKKEGFEWGGDWESFPDKPHFQKSFGLGVTELKEKIENKNFDDRYVNIQAKEIEILSEEEIRQNIIENIKHGRDPYAVEIAGIGGLIGTKLAQKLLEYGSTNASWVAKEIIKFGPLNQAILDGVITSSDFTYPVLKELVEINQTILNSKSCYKDLIESRGQNFEKAIINLSNFVSTGLEKINHNEEAIIESTISAPNSLPYGDASALARAVYNLEDTVGAFKRIKGEDLLAYGVTAEQLVDTETGLKSALYSDGTYTVLAFAGTESGLKDKVADFTQAIGVQTPQYEKAIEVRVALEQLEINNLTFVGQSLGGGLAAAASARTNIDTKIFNAAGVHPNTIGSNQSDFENITHYYTRGEILNVIQTLTPLPDAPAGTTVFAGDHSNYLAYLNPNRFKVIKTATYLHSVY